MGNESIEASFLSVFALISFFIFLITSKYSHKFKRGILLDADFVKPQAFHEQPITRSGGIAIMFSLFIFFEIYYLFQEIFLLLAETQPLIQNYLITKLEKNKTCSLLICSISQDSFS